MVQIEVKEAHINEHQLGQATDYIYCLEEVCEKYDTPVKDVEQDNPFDGGEDQFRGEDR